VSAVDQARAAYWLERWDRQQESYIPDREARFAVLLDTLTTLVTRPDPLVVDLGVGPGSLAHRLLDRLPRARVVGVDADPLLMGLGAAARPDERIRLVQADLRDPEWYAALGLDRAPDAYVSSTALHWMDRQPVRELIATCADTLAPGGVFLDADHLYEGDGGLDDLGRALTRLRGTATGTADGELWQPWWDAVAEAPELAGLVAAREAAAFEHVVVDKPTVHDYLAALRTNGFTTVGQVWQYGDDRVIVGGMPDRDA
jgi:SAM-dependent methyltransferase